MCSYLNADWEQTDFQFMLLKVHTHNLKCTSYFAVFIIFSVLWEILVLTGLIFQFIKKEI